MRRVGLTLALLVCGILAFCKAAYPTYVYRYRITVEVADGDKLHSGSSVIEITTQRQQDGGGTPPTVSYVRGEAIPVDLGAGRFVIATLVSGPNGKNVDYLMYLAPRLFGLSHEDKDLAKFGDMKGSKNVPPKSMPTFVIFKDINDPRSVEVVAPEAFATMLGPGVRLKSVLLTMTNDSVSRNFEARFPNLIAVLREDAKKTRFELPDAPFKAHLGQFVVH